MVNIQRQSYISGQEENIASNCPKRVIKRCDISLMKKTYLDESTSTGLKHRSGIVRIISNRLAFEKPEETGLQGFH